MQEDKKRKETCYGAVLGDMGVLRCRKSTNELVMNKCIKIRREAEMRFGREAVQKSITQLKLFFWCIDSKVKVKGKTESIADEGKSYDGEEEFCEISNRIFGVQRRRTTHVMVTYFTAERYP